MTNTLTAPVDPITKRWKKRLLVFYTPPDTPAAIRRQLRLWEEENEGLDARDLELVMFENLEEQPEIARRFRLAAGKFTVLLIGKDGAEKVRSREPVMPRRVYKEIDSKAFQQDEMKRR